jgi:hypothetical protein
MTHYDKVYIMKTNGTLKEIGLINDDKKTCVTSTDVPDSVIGFNKLVLECVANDNNYSNNANTKIKYEDILGSVFHIMRYRRCTVFLIEQESDMGIRYLAYLCDKIKHGATNFGTTIDLVSKDDIMNEFKKLENFSSLHQFGI